MRVDEEILGALREAGRSHLSGGRLAARLGVSRTTVWKRVGLLRGQGYEIESTPRRGYRLLKAPDLLLPVEIEYGLKTKRIGREIRYARKAVSTIDLARELAVEGCLEGTVVIAEEQTGGRGRMGRSWLSPPGGIWMSVVLRPKIEPVDAPKLTFLVAVAASQAIEAECGIKVAIKWPNDLICEGKKVGGILCEIDAEPDRIVFAILSLGLNANVDIDQFPVEIRSDATSLRAVRGQLVERVGLTQSILARLEENYAGFGQGDFSKTLAEWKKRCETLGKMIRVSTPHGVFEGKALGIDSHGALRLKPDSGRIEVLASGDATLI